MSFSIQECGIVVQGILGMDVAYISALISHLKSALYRAWGPGCQYLKAPKRLGQNSGNWQSRQLCHFHSSRTACAEQGVLGVGVGKSLEIPAALKKAHEKARPPSPRHEVHSSPARCKLVKLFIPGHQTYSVLKTCVPYACAPCT